VLNECEKWIICIDGVHDWPRGLLLRSVARGHCSVLGLPSRWCSGAWRNRDWRQAQIAGKHHSSHASVEQNAGERPCSTARLPSPGAPEATGLTGAYKNYITHVPNGTFHAARPTRSCGKICSGRCIDGSEASHSCVHPLDSLMPVDRIDPTDLLGQVGVGCLLRRLH
jgi:hypothetical protein